MFTFPALLWFLPILGAVILIHLINMFRHRRVEWAAMEFLLASYKKSRTRILLQQLLLMLLRTLAVAAVLQTEMPRYCKAQIRRILPSMVIFFVPSGEISIWL